jgi:hypothetical protein
MLSSKTRAELAQSVAETLQLEDVMDELIHQISEHLNPEDVFSESELENWAESNGYEKR